MDDRAICLPWDKKFALTPLGQTVVYGEFPSHFCRNTCSAGDNYAHARTVDTRLFLSPPTKSLGTRLVLSMLQVVNIYGTAAKIMSQLLLFMCSV